MSGVTAAYDRGLLFKANERFVVLVQTRVRGFLARRRFAERVAFMKTQLPAITKIQVRSGALFTSRMTLRSQMGSPVSDRITLSYYVIASSLSCYW